MRPGRNSTVTSAQRQELWRRYKAGVAILWISRELGQRPTNLYRMLQATGGIYRPRNPQVSCLYQCVRRHSDELDAAGLVHRPVEAEVLERFLDCGDLHNGFARVYCDQCGHDYLLAYSRKTRYLRPSCHQKRMLACGEWLEDSVLAPVPHRESAIS